MNQPIHILTIRQVISRTGLSRATIYRYMQSEQFPQSIPRGFGRNVGWIEAEINEYIEARIQQRRTS